MARGPVRTLLTVIAIVAALATVVFANLEMTFSAVAAAVFAIGFVVEGWRHND